jgi:hypothetical protein
VQGVANVSVIAARERTNHTAPHHPSSLLITSEIGTRCQVVAQAHTDRGIVHGHTTEWGPTYSKSLAYESSACKVGVGRDDGCARSAVGSEPDIAWNIRNPCISACPRNLSHNILLLDIE